MSDLKKGWVRLDWNDPATIPAEHHKVWVFSNRIHPDAEIICQRDGGFYPIDREYPLDEDEESGIWWHYCTRPELPKP